MRAGREGSVAGPRHPSSGDGSGWGFRDRDLCLHWRQWEGSLKYRAWPCPVGASGQLENHQQTPSKLCSNVFAAAAAKSLQLCLTLCDPRDGSPPGSPIPGILQARTLEWVAISFSNTWKWKVKGKSLSRVRLLATPWTAAYQAPPSMEFPRQEYWSGLPLPSPSNVPSTWYKRNHK